MPKALDINHFLQDGPVIIDVRTPKEFAQGHIPGAVNIPLFSDEERAVVGTLYKQQGKEQAILKGLEFVGPKMKDIVVQAKSVAKENNVHVHCWRGGMRSGSVAWLLEMYGMKVFILKGGYKSFRREALAAFGKSYNFKILGGNTGSQKTTVLHSLQEKAAVIDLEKLALHKGSAFGLAPGTAQPTQEQFENELFMELKAKEQAETIWLEDESRLIGKKVIPDRIWQQMRNAPVMFIDVPFEQRVQQLVAEYGKYPKEELAAAISRISRRLGPQHAKEALAFLTANDLENCCRICLRYYDKTYAHGLALRDEKTIQKISCANMNAKQIANVMLNLFQHPQDSETSSE